MLREAIAYVYGWPPDVLDSLPLSRLVRWGGYAGQRIKNAPQPHRCPFLK